MDTQHATRPRLVRRRDGRMIAGVCQGIAEHFGIEPVLVRIAFGVAAFFGGTGFVAYGAAWLLIPSEDESTSIGERVVREHRWARILGIVLIVMAVSSLARPVWWFGGHAVFAVLLILGGIYLLSPGVTRDDGDNARRGDDATTAPPASGPPPPSAPVTEPLPPLPSPHPSTGRRRRRGGLGAITFGLLLIGAGAVGIALASGARIEPTYVFATGVIVVGIALVVSTWIGRGGLLIPLGVVLVGLMSVSTVIDVPISGGIGERRETPLTIADLRAEYHLGIGELQLDMTLVPFERNRTYTVKADVGIGHVLVRVPRDVIVVVHGHAGLGAVQFLDQHDGGVDVERDATLNASGEGPPRLDLELDVGIGQVEVKDAAA